VLSSDERSAWIHSPIHGERAKRAVGLAWLSGDIETTERLTEAKIAFLRSRNDYGLSGFEAFANRYFDERATLGKAPIRRR